MGKRKEAETTSDCSEVFEPENSARFGFVLQFPNFKKQKTNMKMITAQNHGANMKMMIQAEFYDVRLNGEPFYDFFAMEVEKEAVKTLESTNVSDVSLSLWLSNFSSCPAKNHSTASCSDDSDCTTTDVGPEISTSSDAPLAAIPLRMCIPAVHVHPIAQVNWTVKKFLTDSDCNAQHRLLMNKKQAEDHIISRLAQESQLKINTNDGLRVNVLDCDVGAQLQLTLKKWPSSRCYGLMDNWRRDFVYRRGLKAGDEVHLAWDEAHNRLLLTVSRTPVVLSH